MSQEQPPVRSRRELRKARDEALGQNQDAAGTQGAGGVGPASKQPASTGNADASRSAEASRPGSTSGSGTSRRANTAGRVRRVAPGPVDSVPAGSAAERSSQIRARDRAALRTIKQLAEKEEQLSGGGPPTRRQLRLMQLKEQAVTSAMPVVPSAGDAPSDAPVQAAASKKAPPSAGTEPRKPEQQSAAAASGAPPATDPAAGHAGPAVGDLPDDMTVEQALEARALIAEQAKNQLAKMEHIAATDPEAVDPEILAEQIALAERAAVLNKRAMAKQKLAEQNSPAPSAHNGPSTASNLAMVTPLEFVQGPGVDRPVMKRPATSYVPVVTSPGPRVPVRGKRPAKAARSAGTAPSTGRSRVIARAEAAARAAAGTPAVPQGNPAWDAETGEDFTALPPVAAKSAYGLEPLDAATAGLGRAHRLKLLQMGVLALGLMALIAGVIMIISGLAR